MQQTGNCERSDTLLEIQQLLADELGLEVAGLDPALPLDQLGIDSLAFTECLFKIEDKFGISMAEGQIKAETLLEVANMVNELVARKKMGEAVNS